MAVSSARRGPSAYDPRAFPPVAVTVDVVVLTLAAGRLQVLLVERGSEPFLGAWALPGGFIRPHEALDQAVARELREETGVEAAAHLEQIGAYGDPDRDPRMRVVTVAYLAVLRDVGRIVAGTDAVRAELVPVQSLLAALPARRLAFDHGRILEDGIARAREKLASTSLATAFIGPEFTLSDLRGVYEAAWGVQLDPGNFRRKVLSTEGFVEPTGRRVPASPSGGKPAETYTAGGIVALHPPLQIAPLGSMVQEAAPIHRIPKPSAARSDARRRRVWRVHLADDTTVEQTMLDRGVIAFGGDELGDLSNRRSSKAIEASLRAALPGRREREISALLGAWRCFLGGMQIGDYLLASLSGRRIAIGRVRGSYRYQPTAADPRLRHTRSVEWLRTSPQRALAPDLLALLKGPRAISEVRSARAAKRIEALLGSD